MQDEISGSGGMCSRCKHGPCPLAMRARVGSKADPNCKLPLRIASLQEAMGQSITSMMLSKQLQELVQSFCDSYIQRICFFHSFKYLNQVLLCSALLFDGRFSFPCTLSIVQAKDTTFSESLLCHSERVHMAKGQWRCLKLERSPR